MFKYFIQRNITKDCFELVSCRSDEDIYESYLFIPLLWYLLWFMLCLILTPILLFLSYFSLKLCLVYWISLLWLFQIFDCFIRRNNTKDCCEMVFHCSNNVYESYLFDHYCDVCYDSGSDWFLGILWP